MFSRLKQRIPVFAPLGAGLLIITLVTVLGGLWQYQNQLDRSPQLLSPALAASSSQNGHKPNGSQQAGVQNVPAGGAQSAKTDTVRSKVSYTGQAASATSPGTAQTASGASPGSAIVTVSLSVNGSYAGRVTLPGSDNQCDVLSEALSEGVINYLDMRYDPQNRSYAVYVINNIGDSSSVWWTYTVNGGWVPGCSSTPVHNNDSVNWQYIK